jgi:HEAT repeat protein
MSAGALFKRKESPEVRACAALAIGKIRTQESRDLLQRSANDKDLVVRNAVSRALRENPA